MRQRVREAVDQFLNFLFPKSCVLCGKLGLFLCPHCAKEFTLVKDPCCHICGLPFVSASSSHVCSVCLKEKPAYDRHFPVFVFNKAIQELVHKLKYDHQFWARQFFNDYFRQRAESFASVDIVVPIPLYSHRLKKRGYNQSALLAKVWGKILNKPVVQQNLIRIKDTPTQTGYSRQKRKENLKGAFSVLNQKKLVSKSILLVDDVHTTGATLDAATRELKRAGAKQVYATTVAIVMPGKIA